VHQDIFATGTNIMYQEYLATANVQAPVGDPQHIFKLSQGPVPFSYTVQPDGSVNVTFQTPLLVAGGYVGTLLCTSSITNVATTLVSVAAGNAPHATASVTSPVRSGGSAVLTAQGCGRSANGEVQASVRVVGPGSSFSFYGATRSDGSAGPTTIPSWRRLRNGTMTRAPAVARAPSAASTS